MLTRHQSPSELPRAERGRWASLAHVRRPSAPLADGGGTRDRYAPLSNVDTGTLVDALVTPSTRHHAIETTRTETLTVHTTQVREAAERP